MAEEKQDEKKTDEVTLTKEQWDLAYKSPRFKELAEKAKLAEKYEADKKKAEEEDLKKKGDLQKIIDQKDQEINDLKNKFLGSQKANAVIQEAIKLKAVDTDAVVKLIDMDKVTVDDAGNVVGASEAVSELFTNKPYLSSGASDGEGDKPTPQTGNIGNPTNPENVNGNKRVWPLSELRKNMKDREWYKKNEAEVTAAMAEGRVDNSK